MATMQPAFRRILPIWMLFAIWACSSSSVAAAPKDRPLPKFDVIEGVLARYFQTLSEYQPGDLISRSQVEGALDAVMALGWKLTARDQIVKDTLPDTSFLPRSLRTEKGREFMKHIKQDPGAYDRLDRLTAMPQGRETVLALIRGPEGWKMIDYMTRTPGGKNLGVQLSHAPTGHDFNKPTGRIYTADALLARLRQAYEQDAAKRATNQ
jgi:hypothetical protein